MKQKIPQKKKTGIFILIAALLLSMLLAGCSEQNETTEPEADNSTTAVSDSSVDEPSNVNESEESLPDGNDVSGTKDAAEVYTLTTRVTEVMNDPVFGDYGRLIFPVDRPISDDLELQDVADILVQYTHVNPERTVEIANYLRNQAASGEQIFYDIYTEEEKAEDPAKENTGLFFFRGDPGAEAAILSAGGGFEYVAAMHDSFPHALELSERGYNAFALIYRTGGSDVACEDLARAIAFLHDNAEELQISMDNYSLWGGSAGARMSVQLSSYGTDAYGEDAYPAPAAVILQYTAISTLTGNEPPTYACIGTNDGIASYQSMQSRIERIQANGTDAEIEIFDGLEHGFGLGEGTIAEGWINNAISFWENHS